MSLSLLGAFFILVAKTSSFNGLLQNAKRKNEPSNHNSSKMKTKVPATDYLKNQLCSDEPIL